MALYIKYSLAKIRRTVVPIRVRGRVINIESKQAIMQSVIHATAQNERSPKSNRAIRLPNPNINYLINFNSKQEREISPAPLLKGFIRNRRTEGPSRVRGRVINRESKQASMQSVIHATAQKEHCCARCAPTSVTIICCS